MTSVVSTIRPMAQAKPNPNQGGPADLQTDAVASVEIGLGHFVGSFLLIFPHPDSAEYKIPEREATHNGLDSGIKILPVVPCPHPVVERDQNGKDDLVGDQLFQRDFFIGKFLSCE